MQALAGALISALRIRHHQLSLLDVFCGRSTKCQHNLLHEKFKQFLLQTMMHWFYMVTCETMMTPESSCQKKVTNQHFAAVELY